MAFLFGGFALYKYINYSNELFPYYDGKLWGYMKRDGTIAIHPKFNYTTIFTEGLAVVAIKNRDEFRYGFINKKGNIVIKPTFHEAYNFVRGYAKVSINQKSILVPKEAYINKKGDVVTPPESWFLNQTNGLKRFKDQVTNKWGYKNINGQVKVQPQYVNAIRFKKWFRTCDK